jgi:UTP:GlnB (protein PII) uridylyltransferase
VETLGAEVVDVFYVTGPDGKPLIDPEGRRDTVSAVLIALRTQEPPVVR